MLKIKKFVIKKDLYDDRYVFFEVIKKKGKDSGIFSQSKDWILKPRTYSNNPFDFVFREGMSYSDSEMGGFAGDKEEKTFSGLYEPIPINKDDIKPESMILIYFLKKERMRAFYVRKVREGITAWLFGRYQLILLNGEIINSNSIFKREKVANLDKQESFIYQLNRLGFKTK